MNPSSVIRTFHDVSVRFAKTSGQQLAIRLGDIATVLGFSSVGSLTRSSGVVLNTVTYPFDNRIQAISIPEALLVINKCAAPAILKNLFVDWLNTVDKEVKRELGIKDRPTLVELPLHLRSGLLTVRAFMAMHNMELTDGNAQRLGLRATKLRDSLRTPAKKVDIHIQVSDSSFITRSENLYQHSVIAQAYRELFQ